MLLQMVARPRRQSQFSKKGLAHPTTRNCNKPMMQGLHLHGTQNGNIYGTMRYYGSAMLTLWEDSPPTTSHSPLSTCSGAPLSRTSKHITTIFSTCSNRLRCMLYAISHASLLRNVALV